MSLTYACPACGGSSASPPLVVAEMMFGRDEEFTYDPCARCATLTLRDVPPDLAPYYPADYYSIDTDPETALGRPGVRQFARAVARSVLFGRRRVAGLATRAVRRRQFHSFVSVLDSVAFAGLPGGESARVLDVGCGSGIVTYALALAGIATSVGVDPFAPRDRAFDNGAVLLRRDLSAVDGVFDLVMFHHSLEHVPDPRRSLLDAVDRLAPRGRILVRMPTVSADAFDQYGADWVQLDAPRHLTVMSRSGVDALATDCGLRVVATRDDSTAFQFWGSEQVRAGVALMAPSSHLVSERDSAFDQARVAAWAARAATLNARHRGDQAAWVLARAGDDRS